jgi:endonuclease G, mitochondrial
MRSEVVKNTSESSFGEAQPDNNQGPWEKLESYARSLAQVGREVYIIAGGTGSKGSFNGITLPASTWKVIVALQPGKTYSAVPGSTTIAVLMPNINGIRSNGWQQYQTTVATIASPTGYNFSNYPPMISLNSPSDRRS